MHYFSLHCHCVPLHYPSVELSAQLPTPLPLTQCSQYSAKAQENGALNSEFNYSRPSEMLVSRWIKPGSLSKPIFDLKGRQMCFRNITIGLLPSGGCHLPLLVVCCKVRHIYNYREVESSAMTVEVNISRNWPRELPCLLSSSWMASVKKKDFRFTVWSKCLEPPEGPFLSRRRMEEDVSWHH